MVRGIRPHVEGRTVLALRRCRCACRPISIKPDLRRVAARVRGQKVTRVHRVAKRIVLDFASGDSLAIEPRMTGLMLLADPPDREHLRIEIQFSGQGEHGSVWFWDRRGLGTITLYTADELARTLGPERIGPDALLMTDDEWIERCARTGRPIKVALLDQKLAAGIGNLYASEILHRAALHPDIPANRLRAPQVRRMAECVREVLAEAIRYEGSTLGDETYRNALNRAGRYQERHRVYMREEAACLTCGTGSIQRIVQAQRSTFFCPRCQRPPRKSATRDGSGKRPT